MAWLDIMAEDSDQRISVRCTENPGKSTPCLTVRVIRLNSRL